MTAARRTEQMRPKSIVPKIDVGIVEMKKEEEIDIQKVVQETISSRYRSKEKFTSTVKNALKMIDEVDKYLSPTVSHSN